MSGYFCSCGHRIDETIVPKPHGFTAFRDAEFEGAIERIVGRPVARSAEGPMVRQDVTDIVDDLFMAAESPSFGADTCTACGRLHVWMRRSPRGSGVDHLVFTPDHG